MGRRVRVRFAPSPTGTLHMGGVRTALYNYLFARKHGGDFILRIEDTDSARYVEGAEQYILDSLKWCGIAVDEGVEQGGPHAPYRQSERKEIYFKYALELINSGNAYYAFDTPEELDLIRKQMEEQGGAFSYNFSVREKLNTSLTLSESDVKERIERGDNWVVRFKVPEGEILKMNDIIRGDVTINTSTIDDKVIYKSADKLPTYHLANIVDDHLMDISHVIRGEEWLPSLPLHYLLYRALGWSDTQPKFAHLPLILKPVGQGKLSKRDGDKLGFPVFPLEWHGADGEMSRGYREDGYFPEAFINMLALLGWNPGTEQEIFSMEELIEAFSLEKVGKAGARFSPDKAVWFNGQYMHTMPNEKLGAMLLPILEQHGVKACIFLATKIAALIKERATFVSDMWGLCSFLFEAPTEYDQKVVAKFWNEQNRARVADVAKNVLLPIGDFASANIEKAIHDWIEENQVPMGQIMNSLRLCIIGTSKGPSLYEICEILGKDQTINRIETAIKVLG